MVLCCLFNPDTLIYSIYLLKLFILFYPALLVYTTCIQLAWMKKHHVFRLTCHLHYFFLLINKLEKKNKVVLDGTHAYVSLHEASSRQYTHAHRRYRSLSSIYLPKASLVHGRHQILLTIFIRFMHHLYLAKKKTIITYMNSSS